MFKGIFKRKSDGMVIPESAKQYADEYFHTDWPDRLMNMSSLGDELDLIDILQTIDYFLEQREISRKEKRWKDSDKLREILDNIGVFVFDLKDKSMVYYLGDEFFKTMGDKFPTKRRFLENFIEEDRKAYARLDAWIYSMLESNKKKDRKIDSNPLAKLGK